MPQDQTKDDCDSRSAAPLPKLCDRGHVVVISRHYTQITGAAVVMRNLLARFDPRSYTMIVRDVTGPAPAEPEPEVEVHAFNADLPRLVPHRLEGPWRQHQPFLRSRVTRLVKSLSPAVIVGVYPDVEFLHLARVAARNLRIPWAAYIHDPVAGASEHTIYAAWAKTLQAQVFAEASSILVTGDIQRLYREKYGVESKPLPIAYPEPIPTELPDDRDVHRQAFMGGGIYAVNGHSTKRVLTALEEAKCPCVLATTSSDEILKRYGISGDFVRKEFISDRADYIATLRRQGVLVVVFDWPDETDWREEELSIVFPTKAVEYLASGRPILVHCPESYFMAQFFLKHKCGLVVTERDHKVLVDAVNRLLRGGDEIIAMRKAALAAAQLLSMDRLAPIFQSEVNTVARLHWGEKAP